MSRRRSAATTVRRNNCLLLPMIMASCVATQTSLPDPQLSTDLSYSFANGPVSSTSYNEPWWSLFDEPLLHDLLRSGLQGNASLSAAQARITQARANAEAEGVLFNPALTDTLAAARAPGGGAVGYTASVSIMFPVDVSRRQRREHERALIELADALAARDSLMLALSGEIARGLVQISATDERLRHAREDLRRREALVSAVETQIEVGDATQFELFRARASVLDTRAVLHHLSGERDAVAQELLARLGGDPSIAERLTTNRGPLRLRNDFLHSGVPADLVRARPDIRRIELQYDAARTRIADAEADRLPQLSINGTIDGAGAGLGWRFGPTMSLPPLSAQVRDAIVEREVAGAQALLFEWQDSVLVAIAEVEAAYDRMRAAQSQVVALQAADQEYTAALTLAEELFSEGEITILDILDIERSRVETRDSLVDARATYLGAFIDFHLALGVRDDMELLLMQPL